MDAMLNSDPDGPVTFPKSFGAAFVGFAIASVLCGCMSVQVYIYFKSLIHTTDPWGLKVLVVWFWIMDMTESFFQAFMIYEGLIIHFGEPSWFLRTNWSLPLSTIFTVLISASAQIFYARRVYILSDRRKLIPIIIICLAVLSVAFMIVHVSLRFTHMDFKEFNQHYTWASDTFVSFAISANIIIVACISYVLIKSKTGFKETDILLDRLLFLSVNTGVLPTLLELGHLISLAAFHSSFAYLAFEFIAPKLYTNSFLAVLNARHFRADDSRRDTGSSVSTYFANKSYRPASSRTVSSNQRSRFSSLDNNNAGGSSSSRNGSVTFAPPGVSQEGSTRPPQTLAGVQV